MSIQKTAILMIYYGVILILGGLLLLLFTGRLTSISMILCFAGGIASLAIGYFMNKQLGGAFWAGLIFSTLLIFVFGWRTVVEVYELVNMLQNGEMYLEPYNSLHKQVNLFLVCFGISLVSVVVSLNQFVRAPSNGQELSK